MIRTLRIPGIEVNFLKLTKHVYEKSRANILNGETIKSDCFLTKIRNNTKISGLTPYVQHCTKSGK